MMKVQTFTPGNVMKPIGPYSHIAMAGPFITISGTAGVDPTSGQLAGPDTYTQSQQILKSFSIMLESVSSSLEQTLHIHVFMKNMEDFEDMNRAYRETFSSHLPARTVIAVKDLPKQDALLTMNLNAIINDTAE